MIENQILAEKIGMRFICLCLGYFIGSFLTACLVVKIVRKKSVFAIGSGNPGMANVMAECGFKAGIFVLAGDLFKVALAFLICLWINKAGGFHLNRELVAAWTGFGCILGHDFPFWHRFSGGKGVACTCAALFLIHPLYGLPAMLIGMIMVFITKYLVIGALVIPGVFIPVGALLYGPEMAILSGVFFAVMLLRHRKDLKGVLEGTQKKVDILKALKNDRKRIK